jgi:hypothetical protein
MSGCPFEVAVEKTPSPMLSSWASGLEVVPVDLFRADQSAGLEDFEPERTSSSFKALGSRPRLDAASRNCFKAGDSSFVSESWVSRTGEDGEKGT